MNTHTGGIKYTLQSHYHSPTRALSLSGLSTNRQLNGLKGTVVLHKTIFHHKDKYPNSTLPFTQNKTKIVNKDDNLVNKMWQLPIRFQHFLSSSTYLCGVSNVAPTV